MQKRTAAGFLRHERGVAAVEFGIVAAILMILFVCAVDYGMGFYSNMQVQNAAQAGAEYAATHGFNAGAISSAVTNASTSSGITISSGPTKFCGCPSSTGVTTASCGTTCSDGKVAGTYVSISAARNYSTLFNYPGIPATINQTATATVRIQ